MKNEIITLLTGGQSVAFFIVFMFMSVMGMALSMLVHYGKKGAKKQAFSWKYWFEDNWRRAAASIIIIYLIVACFPYMEGMLGWIFEKFGIPYALNIFVGALLGVFIDQVII